MTQDPSSSMSLEDQVATLTEGMRDLRRQQRESRRRSRNVRFVAGAAVLLIGGLWGRRALSQSSPCSPLLPAGMKTFCPNTPAVATEVNGNLKQLYDWLSQKVGTPGSPDVTVTGNLTVNGTISAPQAKLAGSLSVGTAVQAHASLPASGCGTYEADQTTTTSYTPDKAVCFLTQLDFQNSNDSWVKDPGTKNPAAGEHQCVVDVVDGKWQLTAKVDTYGAIHSCHQEDLYCTMRCVSWDAQ
jgi:hypothetical protein